MQIGPWKIDIVNAGFFRLDGGTMFGTVPKVLWSKLYPCDDQNRILHSTNCLLARGEVGGRRHVVLVDTGNGAKDDDAWRERYCMGRDLLLEGLASLGVGPEDVGTVVLTHLHFDHAGGATKLDAAGRPVPTFPNARYLVQAIELRDAQTPHPCEKASYRPQDFQPLLDCGCLHAVEGDVEILPGLTLRHFPGHTKGLQGVEVSASVVPGTKVVFPSDLIPTSRHVKPTWTMAYDLDVVGCVDQRLRLYEEILDTDTVVVFGHDPDTAAGYLKKDARGRVCVRPLDPAPGAKNVG
jgi:glyoxylase-like metal-dependent hydrolase (beta-lactamase superfamily II)